MQQFALSVLLIIAAVTDQAMAISYSTVFSTTNQTPFGAVSNSTFYGSTWSESAGAGNSSAEYGCPPWDSLCYFGSSADYYYGTYGGKVTGSTSGKIGMNVTTTASGGSFSAAVGANISLNSRLLDNNQLLLTSFFNTQSLSFTAAPPQVGVYVDLPLKIKADASIEVCVVDCVTPYSGSLINIDESLSFFQYASTGTLSAFGLDLSGAFGRGIPIPINFNINRFSALFPENGSSTGYTVARIRPSLFPSPTDASAQVGPGQTFVSAVSNVNPLVDFGIDFTNIFAAGVALATGEFPPLNSSIPGVFGYNLLKAEGGLSLGLQDKYDMFLQGGGRVKIEIPELNFTQFFDNDYFNDQLLHVPDTSDGIVNIGNIIQLPDGSGTYTIKPTFYLNDPMLYADYNLFYSPYFDLSALSINALGFNLGPVYKDRWQYDNWNTRLRSLSAYLGGFSAFEGQSFQVQVGTSNNLPPDPVPSPTVPEPSPIALIVIAYLMMIVTLRLKSA